MEEKQALSRLEVMRRRRQQREDYCRHQKRKYWALVEEEKAGLQAYDWTYGKSPLAAAECDENGGGEGNEDGVRGGDDSRDENGDRRRCAIAGCKSMAMPLTRYCHPHILNDARQTLYKPCNFVLKSNPQIDQVKCAKSVDVAAMPSLCSAHLQKVQKSIAQASKKLGLGLNTSSSSRKSVTKYTNVMADSVRQIQTRRRRKALKGGTIKAVKED